MNINQQIKKYRNQNNISQEDLAEILFVSRQTISNWETKKTYPDLRSLLMMSDYFEISLDELVKGDLSMMEQKKSVQFFYNLATLSVVSFIIALVGAQIILSKGIDLIYLIPFIVLFTFYIYTAFKMQKVKKDEDIHTYKEIKAYMENKSLNETEKEVEVEKCKNNRIKSIILKMLCGAIVGGALYLLVDMIFPI